MKPYIFILCLLLAACAARAQYQYVPIPKSNATWSATNSYNIIQTYNCHKFQYNLTGAYTINGPDTFYVIEAFRASRYSKYWPPADLDFFNSCSNLEPFNAPFQSDYTKPDTSWLLEKDKKVYVFNSPAFDTSLQFRYLDFSVDSVGQVLKRQLFTDTVLSIDTININGTLRRRIITTLTEVISIPDTLIEGIGSLRSGLGFGDLRVYPTRDARIYCVSVNSVPEYTFNNSACAEMWPLALKEVQADDMTCISPNPFLDKLTINTPVACIVRAYNVVGRCVYSSSMKGKNKLDIHTQNWPPGLYLVKIDSETGGKAFKAVKY